MFSRQPEKEAPHAALAAQPFGASTPPSIPSNGARPSGSQAGSGPISVIGSDLTIIGAGLKIVSKGTLQIDGEVQGDVLGTKVVIGSGGKVTGLVNAEHVVVDGAVFGTIKGVNVTLKSTAEVEGDIYHQMFTLEQGGMFEGRSRRSQDTSELIPNLSSDAVSSPQHSTSNEFPGTSTMPAHAETTD